MYSFSYLEPVCCSMSSSNCCFLTCIQISQETDQVVWYPQLFQNFTRFIVIHTVKGFGIVNKAEIDVFLGLSSFFNDPADMVIWSLVPQPFLKPAWTSRSSRFTYCWSLAWRLWLNILKCLVSYSMANTFMILCLVCYGSSFSNTVPMKGLWEYYSMFPCKSFAICLWPLYLKVSSLVSSVAQSCTTLYNPMNCSTPGLPVYH